MISTLRIPVAGTPIQGFALPVSPKLIAPMTSSTPASMIIEKAMVWNQAAGLMPSTLTTGDDHGSSGPDEHEAQVDLGVEHGPQGADPDVRRQVFDGGRQRHGFEQAHVHVGEQQRPGAEKRPAGAQAAMGVDVLAARLRHGGHQFAVGESDQRDGEAADRECDQGAQGTRFLDPEPVISTQLQPIMAPKARVMTSRLRRTLANRSGGLS